MATFIVQYEGMDADQEIYASDESESGILAAIYAIWEEAFPDEDYNSKDDYTILWGNEEVSAEDAARISAIDDEEVLEAIFKDEDLETALKVMEEHRYSKWGSGGEYAEEFCRDVGYLPKNLPWWLSGNIDWEGVWDDINADETYVELENGVIVIYDKDF